MDKKKQHLMETAKGLFFGQGFRKTTIQSIADAAGVSKGAVYLHFKSKKDIFFQIILQVEEQIWSQVQRIDGDRQSTDREKLIGIIEVHFDYLHENRLLTELLVHEVGLAMSEEMLQKTTAMRVRWQLLFNDNIGRMLEQPYRKFRADLGFSVVGLLEMFHASLVVDNLQIDKQVFTEFLLLLVDTMGPALGASGRPPMIRTDYLENREKTVRDLEQQRQTAIRKVLGDMESILARSVSPEAADQRAIFEESVHVLKRECFSDKPNAAVIQGMLAGLRTVAELALPRQRLAELMDVRLV